VNARETVLARIRTALTGTPPSAALGPPLGAPEPFPDDQRHYATTHTPDDAATLAALLTHRLTDYRAHVHATGPGHLPDRIARLLAERGSTSVVAPADVPHQWLERATGVRTATGGAPLTAHDLDGFDTALTGCALAIAETGTIVLDGGRAQGPRHLALIPDHHICVVHSPRQIVASLPRAMPRLDPARPQTWISGPSATSDIELTRVEGVHGPRVLDVVLVHEPGPALA
jgi:L-lactate dehydrogenase complex protein LldG